jgi:hypothetical protein
MTEENKSQNTDVPRKRDFYQPGDPQSGTRLAKYREPQCDSRKRDLLATTVATLVAIARGHR